MTIKPHHVTSSMAVELELLETEVRVLSLRPVEHSLPVAPLQSSRFTDYIEESLLEPVVPEPVRLKGVGATTLFGLNSQFEDDFPSALHGKVAQEEFSSTMAHVNAILHKSVPSSLKCLLCACLCCCCTLGLSLGPVCLLSKRTKSQLDKFLENENWRLYNKLGVNFRLSRDQCRNSNLREYVILIEFLPKLPLYSPD